MNRWIPTTMLFALVLAACSGGSTYEPVATAAVPTAAATPSDAAMSAAAAPESTAAEPTDEPTPAPTAVADPLLARTLTDVRTGQTFTLAALAADRGPLLLEPMAVWCTNCRAQQREVLRAHGIADFASVSIDVDLSETPDDLAAYADREGFDWPFAMADADLYRLLQERFGTAATHPPSTPLIVIEADGTVRPLEFAVGTSSAEQLIDELGAS